MGGVKRYLTILGVFLLGWGEASAGDGPRERVEAVLRRALEAAGRLQTHGGWGRAYTRDGAIMWGEYLPIPKNWITVQPPATPEVAGVYLRAARVLHDEGFELRARTARDALLRLQTKHGGFHYEGDPDGLRPLRATLDDDTTTAALDFLIDWWRHTGKDEDRQAVERVGDFLLQAQYPDSGGWPQAYPPPSGGYAAHITFNDEVMANVIRALLHLHRLTGQQRYLDGARKGGDCIIRLQGGPGEEIWAQQYDEKTLAPAWARKFEPPGYTPAESCGACDVLIDLYLETGEERFLGPLPKAFAWYESHRLPNGKWARLYEPGTQRPVYGRRDEAVPVYDYAQACSGYGWEGDWYPHAAKQAYERIQAVGREAYARERRAIEEKPKPAPAEAQVTALCDALSEDGWWLSAPDASDLEQYAKHGVPESVQMVDMGRFNRNAHVLLDYLEKHQ